jgi:hypothetical protein
MSHLTTKRPSRMPLGSLLSDGRGNGAGRCPRRAVAGNAGGLWAFRVKAFSLSFFLSSRRAEGRKRPWKHQELFAEALQEYPEQHARN